MFWKKGLVLDVSVASFVHFLFDTIQRNIAGHKEEGKITISCVWEGSSRPIFRQDFHADTSIFLTSERIKGAGIFFQL